MNVRLKIFRGHTIEDHTPLVQHHHPGCEGFDLFRPVGSKKDGLSGMRENQGRSKSGLWTDAG